MRHLLPFEAQLCEVLGISAEEYLYFEQLTQAYNGKRPEGYELIPDVRNDPVSIIISVVVGAALTAAATLLAPKPKAPEIQAPTAAQENNQPTPLQTANLTGASRFTTNTGFNSVQQLAALGETVPLVFANRSNSIGGIRVKTVLLWSQLISQSIQQELKALTMLSSGALAADPDFQGYAIGDQTLKNYTNAKLALYFRENGGRIVDGDKYAAGTLPGNPSGVSGFQDVFSVFDDGANAWAKWFCGTRTPSTQTQFGCFSPMVNATPYRLNYELVLIPKAQGTKDQLKIDAETKIKKIDRDWASRAGMTSSATTNGVKTITYTITEGKENSDGSPPWGREDVNSAVKDLRIVADDELQLNGLYMAGNAHVICTAYSTSNIWELGTQKSYTLRVDEDGYFKTFPDPSALSDKKEAPNPVTGPVLQRLAVATIANNRACDATEIGIKSTVWKQINGFPNVNSIPDSSTINFYQKNNGSISLGSINRYVKRVSFFRLQVRPLGTGDSAWTLLDGDKLFAVEGNTPSPKYNYLRINHPKEQYEFRLVPYPGSEVIRLWLNQSVYFMGGDQKLSFSKGNYQVVFNGYEKTLTVGVLSNPEFVKGFTPETTGTIEKISPTNNSAATGLSIPTYKTTVQETIKEKTCYYDVDTSGSCPKATSGWIEWKTTTCGHPNNSHTTYFKGSAVGGAGGSDGGFNIVGYQKGAEKFKEQAAFSTQWIAYEVCLEKEKVVSKVVTKTEAPVATTTYTVPGGDGTATIQVKRYSNGYRTYTLKSGGNSYQNGGSFDLTDDGFTQTITYLTDENKIADKSLNIYDAAIDIYKYDSENSSHMSSPEHEVVYVNEIVKQDEAPTYDQMALVGVRLASSREWSSFSQLSAYIKKGVVVERLIDDSGNTVAAGALTGPTNNFAEIAYALLTNTTWGAGQYVGVQAVDRDRMVIAAKYCKANGFTWDGIVAAPVNLRSWIFENAAYNLLDFTVLGGKFSLAPTCAHNSSYVIDDNKAVEIKALFTDGNIKDLSVSWLSPEERRLFKAVVKYREEKENGFSSEKMFTLRLANSEGGSDNDPEEEFSLASFCTQKSHALKFAKTALRLRQLVDHSVTFQTTPAAALNLTPGEHFRLVSEVTHTDRFANGVITADGMIVSSTGLADGTYGIIYWVPGTTTGVTTSTMTVVDGVCSEKALHGSVYTISNTTTTSRVYKVETISIGDEGFIEVAASYEPVFSGLNMQILNWADSQFVLEEG